MEYEIYILATKSKTCFSRLIHFATAAPYTHVSIGLNGLDGDFYSFGRKYMRLLLPAGLVKEGIRPRGRTGVKYQLYRLTVSEGVYQKVKKHLWEMYGHREQYHFNILGAFAAFFNRPLHRQSRYFCSQFVAETLQESGALEFDKNIALVRPIDFCEISNLQLVSEGMIGELGSAKDYPNPSEVVAWLPFGERMVRAYRHFR
ncbi:MAG: hypothetical protein K2O18_03085 [Oscillospiraceae bacterium]|nr:hypothetical protein [Oscillospiraceae bacterium]